jgi:hypothetical protein
MSGTQYPIAEAATQRFGYPMVSAAFLIMAATCLPTGTSFAEQNHPLRPVAAPIEAAASQAGQAAHAARMALLGAALQEALTEATEWNNTGDIDLPNPHTWVFAAGSLVRLTFGLAVDAPLLTPLQGGGLGAEWHAFGLNIELRYRGPYDTYVLIEDVRGRLETRASRGVSFEAVRGALEELARRAV